jgi:integrase
MPAKQRGSLQKSPAGTWGARWYDETGARRRQGGFATKSEAGEWLGDKLGEITALRRGDVAATRRLTMPTFDELCDEFEAQHPGEVNTVSTLKARLAPARRKWGSIRINRISAAEVALWRKTLPERSAWGYQKALRQVLGYAVRTKLLDENVAQAVPNPEPKRREVQAFATPEDVEAVADELPTEYALIPILGAWTGLRPEEWIALERGDIDRKAKVLHVRRVYTDGNVKLYGKQEGSLRAVPLPSRALGGVGEGSGPDRHATAVQRRSWWLPGPALMAGNALEPGGHRCGVHTRRCGWEVEADAFALRAATHLRRLGDRRRHRPIRALPANGNLGGADRPHLRAPAPRLAGSCSNSLRRVCIYQR